MVENYLYRCVPVPAQKVNTPDVDRAAAVILYEHIEKQMRDGYEFHGSHIIHTWRSPGCLGALLGGGNLLYNTTVLVFRRRA